MFTIHLKAKHRNLFYSLLLSVTLSWVFFTGWQLTGGSKSEGLSNRIFTLLGGNVSGGGYIQALTFFAFFWAMFDIYSRLKNIKLEISPLHKKLLPTKEKHILLPQDVAELYVKVSDFEKEGKTTLLTEMIKKATLKFRATKNIGEMIEIISIQTEIDKEKSESSQSNIRYLAWVIPSIGFIGTVLGISQALRVANSGDMNLITSTLGVAFDTTLISLVLSIIVMWFLHNLQEETDRLHASLKEYVIENLVNRIEM